MANRSSTSPQAISLPAGGGALRGIGETFSPDLHTGTGNFTIPIALPPGRNGFQPQLSLVYSTGNGNGPFGLGWSLSVPGVSRKTSMGVPRYHDDAAVLRDRDTFLLSGAEDLVPVPGGQPGSRRYRPRTEGSFARIERHRDASDDYWLVRSRDGLVSYYGTPRPAGANQDWQDPAVVADPAARRKVFAWKLTRTEDPFGNRIEYEYERDTIQDGHRLWDQLYLTRVRYIDYIAGTEPRFLVSCGFQYETRPDAFSDHRAGFEIRTTRRCRRVEVRTHPDADLLIRSYELDYVGDALQTGALDRSTLPPNGVSLLRQVRVIGHDGDRTQELPPLEVAYTRFEPEGRRFFPLQGADLPAGSLASPDLDLVDLGGDGLPDILQMNGAVRYWRNLGGGRFALPREMRDAPAGLQLADPGVQLVDADGDGRIDLLVTTNGLAGYFPLQFNGEWDRRSFQRHRQSPSFDLQAPDVRLVDLDGDGVIDAIRSGSRLECFFNDPEEGWGRTRTVERRGLELFPDVDFSDPRVRWADMSGDGLQDVVLVHDGNVEYWPSLGHGDWGPRVHMRNSPRLPFGYNPRLVLLGDVDGDGLADLVYVDHRRVLLWINQSGNGWTDPIEIDGTPPVTDADAVRLVDLLGSGISGVLWSTEANGLARHHMFFLDFTGGIKPYLLNETDNHMGALTRVQYRPSTAYYLEDAQRPATRWQTPLPFPVQVVACVEVVDELSRGKLATEYRYHHGYWDGADREFRGFGMVEQFDTESFEQYSAPGLHGDDVGFVAVDPIHYSPPTLTKTWFHQGPIGGASGEWHEASYHQEYWSGDPPLLERPASVMALLGGLPRRARRDALRAFRGQIVRTEHYALDGTARQNRPYTVAESAYGLREESPPAPDETDRPRIFFPHLTAQRTTRWERGDEPMTRLSFTGEHDPYGQPRSQIDIAVPRWRGLDLGPRVDVPSAGLPASTPQHIREHAVALERYLATQTATEYGQRDASDVYIVDRVARTTRFEIDNDGQEALRALAASVAEGRAARQIIGQAVSFYDGPAFQGLPFGQLGDHGALTRTETLVLTEELLHEAYRSGQGVLNPPEEPPYLSAAGVPAWTAEYPQEFRLQMAARAGYTHQPGGAGSPYAPGYFAATERRQHDFQVAPGARARGLTTVIRDALGRDTSISYDVYDLLPTQVADPANLAMQAFHDYRVLQPASMIDPNGNRTRYTFTPLGLLESISVMGKDGEQAGDTRAQPSTRFDYDVLAFSRSQRGGRQPVHVHTVRRVHHAEDQQIPPPERNETIETREYSDGFGRLLQTRAQGEDVRFGNAIFGGEVLPIDQNDSDGTRADVVGRSAPSGTLTVVVSGAQVYDNKGRLVERYEPFFATGWAYAAPGAGERGQRVTTYYDPRGQPVRTVNPDGSEQRVIHGIPANLSEPERFTPTAWEAYAYDENDNAGRTHPAEAQGYRHHWNTPGSEQFDALGRTVETVERNRAAPTPLDPFPPIEEIVTRSRHDVRGNLIDVTDPLGRRAFRHAYDLANRPLRTDSIDAGLRRTVLDAAGSEVERRDGKGALVLRLHDILGRPTRLWARDDAGAPVTLRERLEYGDGGDPAQPAVERSANRSRNRLGRLHRYHDEAGLLAIEGYDFKGNVAERVRQVIRDEQILSVFPGPGTAPPPGWQLQAFRVDWQPPPGTALRDHAAALLDAIEYRTSIGYDALNRVRAMRYPAAVDGGRRELRPRYNRAGALERVELDGATYVEHVAYDAKGQRTLIAYGQGVMTRYAYDPRTVRLARLRTERYARVGPFAYRPTGAALQDLAHRYDLAGNVTTIGDRAPVSGIPGTPLGADALDRAFTYDPLYRLLSATGRECDLLPDRPPWDDRPRCVDLGRTRAYTQQYEYDRAGSLTRLRHVAGAGSFTRAPTPDLASNRLASLTTGNGFIRSHVYAHDGSGNLVRENGERHLEWDHGDRLKAFRIQTGTAEPSTHAHHLYDAGGQRVKKLVRQQGGGHESTVYIDGLFEHHRMTGGANVQENNTVHILDDQRRIATARVGAAFPGDGAPAVQYHLSDHLGSSNVVIDDAAAWINREEYTPYGETSFGAFARKRYRFNGKERDEESGLYYHEARYYAPWLGRWMSPDPAGTVDGPNLFSFNRNNPVAHIDRRGLNSETSDSLKAEFQKIVEEQATLVEEKNVLLEKQGPAEASVFEHEELVLRSELDVTLDPTKPGDQRKIAQREHNLRQARTNLKRIQDDLGSIETRLEGLAKARDKIVKRVERPGLLDRLLGRRPDPDLARELGEIEDLARNNARHVGELRGFTRRLSDPSFQAPTRPRGAGTKLRSVGRAILPSILTYITDQRLILATEVMQSGRPPTESELEVIQNWGFRFKGIVNGRAEYDYQPNLLQEIGNNWYMRFKRFEQDIENAVRGTRPNEA
jgi:RHS repeat-associated protein